MFNEQLTNGKQTVNFSPGKIAAEPCSAAQTVEEVQRNAGLFRQSEAHPGECAFSFALQLVQQHDHTDDDTGDDKDAQIVGAHDGQGFHQKIHTHRLNLQS